jgi:hypothetical protein
VIVSAKATDAKHIGRAMKNFMVLHQRTCKNMVARLALRYFGYQVKLYVEAPSIAAKPNLKQTFAQGVSAFTS